MENEIWRKQKSTLVTLVKPGVKEDIFCAICVYGIMKMLTNISVSELKSTFFFFLEKCCNGQKNSNSMLKSKGGEKNQMHIFIIFLMNMLISGL